MAVKDPRCTVSVAYANNDTAIIKWDFHTCGTQSSFGLALDTASFATTAAMNKLIHGMKCVFAVTDPGSQVTCSSYSIGIKDSFGCDIFGGKLAGLSSAATQQIQPGESVRSSGVFAIGRFVHTGLKISGGAISTLATGSVRLYFQR